MIMWGSKRMSELQIFVTSRVQAGRILSSADCAKIHCLVSIGDPDAPAPEGFENVTHRLRLLFEDTDDAAGPRQRDVQRIIRLARKFVGKKARILVHCEAGISRSSAAAIIMYAVVLGPGKEAEAFERVMRQRPIASPNGRMIELADGLLKRDGALIRALAAMPQI